MNSNTVPTLDELVPSITVAARGTVRFVTPQEARAIAALENVLDDQPPPAARVRPRRVEVPKQEPKAVIPQVFAPAAVEYAPDPVFVAPAFVRARPSAVLSPVPAPFDAAETTTRDEMLAVAREVAARATPPGQPQAQTIEKVADLMPFGQATLRLFCC